MSNGTPSLLQAGALTPLGLQTLFLGLLMLSMGIALGINFVAHPALQAQLTPTPLDSGTTIPTWAARAAKVELAAWASAAVALLGLVYVDYTQT
jgi:hypothetical protein